MTAIAPNLGRVFNGTARPATDEDIKILATGDWIKRQEHPWCYQFKKWDGDRVICTWEGDEFFIPRHELMVVEVLEYQACEKFFKKSEPKFKVGDRVRDTFNPRKPRTGAIADTKEFWAVIHWDGAKHSPNGQQWSYEYLEKIKDEKFFMDESDGESWNPEHFGEVQEAQSERADLGVCIKSRQECFSVEEGAVLKEQLPQDTNPSGQLKTTPTPHLCTESDSQIPNSLNKTLPPSLTNLSETSPPQTLSFSRRLALTFPWLENEPDLMELAEACFLEDSNLFGSNVHLHSSLKMLTDSLAQTTELPSRKSSKRLQVWGIAAPGNLGMETATFPKTENEFSSWAITGEVRTTQPKLTKKSLQEIFDPETIPVKVYVDGVEEAQESPTFCAGGWQHRSPLHRDKRGASFAVLYRAAGGDRIYHNQAPCLRSPNNSGTGAYKIREYQGENYLERPINATEAEQLMGWEVGSTAIGINKEGDEITISQTQRIKILGNGIVPGEITDILTAIKPMLERKLESEAPENMRFAYRQLRQRGMSHQEALKLLTS